MVYIVKPFGMQNTPATFQRMINQVISGLDGCAAYLDDVVVFSHCWEQHIHQLRDFFHRLHEGKLTINLMKSEFCHVKVTFLGHVVGQGQVAPVSEAITRFPVSTDKSEMAGYYRKFCHHFSSIAEPLTALLKGGVNFVWSGKCQAAFEEIKLILHSEPILLAPDFDKQFKLYVDASDIGLGAMLLQEDEEGHDHSICFFFKKVQLSPA